jgi:hypothetical protein
VAGVAYVFALPAKVVYPAQGGSLRPGLARHDRLTAALATQADLTPALFLPAITVAPAIARISA